MEISRRPLASLHLVRALGIPLTALFRASRSGGRRVTLNRAKGLDIERRGTRAGPQYSLLGHIDDNSSGVQVEPYLITLTAESDVFPTFQHEGLEFLYMISAKWSTAMPTCCTGCRAGEQPAVRC